MAKHCTYVVIVYDWLWSGRFQAIKTWAKKAAPALLLAPAYPIFTFSLWGSDWRECALEIGGFHQNTSSTFPRGIPSLSTCWLQLRNPPALLPPNCYQVPQDSFVQCVVLSMLLLQQFKQNSSFQFSEMETSACNFANPSQGPFLLFCCCCFDWLPLTCKQNPQRSSKGKDPSGQTSVSHKGRLFMRSHPPME